MLTVAQVCAIQPGDEQNASWVNPGFTGVVREINERNTKAGKKFYPCVIADMTGPETIEVSFFQKPPPFEVGDLVDIFGKGLRRTEYNGNPQAAIGKETQVHVIGKSAHEPEQQERAATMQPSVSGKPQPVPGQTVGMAVKTALDILSKDMTHDDLVARLISPPFWASVHEVASDIIRVSRMLEAGKLAQPIKERGGSAQPSPQPQGGRDERLAPKAQPSQVTWEEDVPF